MKAYKVNTVAILAGSDSTQQVIVDKNASGPEPAKGINNFFDDDWD